MDYDWFENDDFDTDIEVDFDVCMCCGKYYTVTDSLKDKAIRVGVWNPNGNGILPQHCFKCIGV